MYYVNLSKTIYLNYNIKTDDIQYIPFQTKKNHTFQYYNIKIEEVIKRIIFIFVGCQPYLYYIIIIFYNEYYVQNRKPPAKNRKTIFLISRGI